MEKVVALVTRENNFSLPVMQISNHFFFFIRILKSVIQIQAEVWEWIIQFTSWPNSTPGPWSIHWQPSLKTSSTSGGTAYSSIYSTKVCTPLPSCFPLYFNGQHRLYVFYIWIVIWNRVHCLFLLTLIQVEKFPTENIKYIFTCSRKFFITFILLFTWFMKSVLLYSSVEACLWLPHGDQISVTSQEARLLTEILHLWWHTSIR